MISNFTQGCDVSSGEECTVGICWLLYWMCEPFCSKGACVWVPDSGEVWVCAQLEQDYQPGDQQLTLKLSDGTVTHTHTHTGHIHYIIQT